MIAVVIKSEFRKQLIWRLGGVKRFFFELLYGNCNSLYIERDAKIGDGFMVVHGAGVVIGGGCCIGKNFTIYQNSTVGWNKGFPKIGNNVYVGAGAVIIGDINIGDNVKIGAGTVVVDDIPNNSTVVGIKPRVIMHNKNQ